MRGSTPAPGADFVRVGGNTSCIAVWTVTNAYPTLILDAGTGIRSVSALLGGAAFHGTILLTHLHWDHVQGLPFFAAGDRVDARVRLVLPDQGVAAATELARAMSPPHFPIGPEGLLGQWSFATVGEGEHHIEGVRVVAREVPHKGGRTFGYRIEDTSGCVAYLPDHRPSPGEPVAPGVRELVDGVDVLIHDAQFSANEADVAAAYGHATIDQVLALAAQASVGELVLFHHAPTRTDAEVDRLLAAIGPQAFAVRAATEGHEVALDRAVASSG